jgi:hypothetical protein
LRSAAVFFGLREHQNRPTELENRCIGLVFIGEFGALLPILLPITPISGAKVLVWPRPPTVSRYFLEQASRTTSPVNTMAPLASKARRGMGDDPSPDARAARRKEARQACEAAVLNALHEAGQISNGEYIRRAEALDPGVTAQVQVETNPNWVPDPDKEPLDLDGPQYAAYVERLERERAPDHELASTVVSGDGDVVNQGADQPQELP